MDAGTGKTRAGIAAALGACLLAAACGAWAEAGAKQDMQAAGQQFKEAAHSFGAAVKRTAHQVGESFRRGADGVKKFVHDTAHKVEDKTAAHPGPSH